MESQERTPKKQRKPIRKDVRVLSDFMILPDGSDIKLDIYHIYDLDTIDKTYSRIERKVVSINDIGPDDDLLNFFKCMRGKDTKYKASYVDLICCKVIEVFNPNVPITFERTLYRSYRDSSGIIVENYPKHSCIVKVYYLERYVNGEYKYFDKKARPYKQIDFNEHMLWSDEYQASQALEQWKLRHVPNIDDCIHVRSAYINCLDDIDTPDDIKMRG